MHVEIRKAKIYDGLFLEVEYNEALPNSAKRIVSQKCTIPVHEDLKGSFHQLHKHLALICEQVEGPAKNFDEWYVKPLDHFKVTGFSIGGHDDTEGVTLIGSKELESGKTLNLISPFIKWTDEGYSWMEELRITVDGAIHEVHEYLFEGKRAPERQLEMFGDEAEIVMTVAKKRGRPKKELPAPTEVGEPEYADD